MIRITKDTSNTSEATYITSLPWKWNGISWQISNVPQYTKDKIKTIFAEWGIGWDADIRGCSKGIFNIHVCNRQFQRVGINFIIPESEETNESV